MVRDKIKSAFMANEEGRVMIVDDDKDFVAILTYTLKSFGYKVDAAYSAEGALKKIKHFNAQVALLDIRLGRTSGISLIGKLKRAGILCVMMTAYAEIDTAITALQEGAYDYLRKPLDPEDLLATLARCFEKRHLEEAKAAAEAAVKARNEELLQTNTRLTQEIEARKKTDMALRKALTEVEQLKNRLQAENIYLQDEIKIEHNFEKIICRSNVFKKLLRTVEQVAPTNVTVLVLGETGTGKELIARAIHNISNRKDRPLVKINCAALPATLIESELFGHEKGAFTGAFTRKIGRFELADSGTIFLDEIGDLPLELQAKLLRVLQEGEFERLGNPRTIKVDVRIIAATNRNLEKAVKTGYFREDLYYRLNVFPFKCPPLRDRKDDIPLLVNHFIKRYNAKLGKRIESIPLKLMSSLQAYHWPGNVREMENVIERAVILSNGSTLELDELFDRPANQPQQDKNSVLNKESERSLIYKTLDDCYWVIEGKRGAAARLGIAPSTLRDRMKKYGIQKHLPPE